jgi:hypothetical protein
MFRLEEVGTRIADLMHRTRHIETLHNLSSDHFAHARSHHRTRLAFEAQLAPRVLQCDCRTGLSRYVCNGGARDKR